jgi:hypothetical protein
LSGYYIAGALSVTGLGLINRAPSFITMGGALCGYMKINRRFFSALGFSGEFSNHRYLPFVFAKALGYLNTIRGMELVTVDGNAWTLGQFSLKYQIVKPRQKQLPFIRNEKFGKIHYAFYLTGHYDAGYVWHPDPSAMPHSEEYLYGYGAGIDFVTYYDRVLRIDFSMNKFGDAGVFLHFSAPF